MWIIVKIFTTNGIRCNELYTNTKVKNKGKEGIQNPYPWWYGLRSSHPTQPTYATLEIGWDKIEYKCYKIMNVLGKDKNGQSIVIPYGTQTKELYDSYTLNWRRKGQDPL